MAARAADGAVAAAGIVIVDLLHVEQPERARPHEEHHLGQTCIALGRLGDLVKRGGRQKRPACREPAGGLGLCLAAALIAAALVTLPAGRHADRSSRRRLMVASQVVLAGIALALARLEPHAGLAIFVVAAAFSGGARAAFDAGTHAILQHTVPPERLRRAIGDLTSRFHMGQLVGVTAAAVCVTAVGMPITYLACAAAFGLGAAISATHHVDLDLGPDARPAVDHAIRRSWNALVRVSDLRLLTMCSIMAGLIAGMTSASFAPFLRSVLGFGVAYRVVFACGLMMTGIAILVVPVLVAHVPWKRVIIACLAAESAALLVIGLARGPGWAAFGDGLLLFASVIIGAAIHRRRAERVPDALRAPIGLTGGIISSLALAAGALLAGPLASWVGLAGEYRAMSAVGLVATACIVPALIRVERRGRIAVLPA